MRPMASPVVVKVMTQSPQRLVSQLARSWAIQSAAALRDWALGPRGLTALVSYIDPRNSRSIRLAERLGAWQDRSAVTPGNEPTLTYRHAPGRIA